MLLGCIALEEDAELGGEHVGGLVTDGIRRSGGGIKCCPPGIPCVGRKLLRKLPPKPPPGIPPVIPGIMGELDSEDDDFRTSSWRVEKFILVFVDGTIELETLSATVSPRAPEMIYHKCFNRYKYQVVQN